MTKELDSDMYLSNKGSQNYVDIDMFVANGLDHRYIDYTGPKYRQCFKNFIPNLSIIDMLFNLGPDNTYSIIADDNNYKFSEINKRIEE